MYNPGCGWEECASIRAYRKGSDRLDVPIPLIKAGHVPFELLMNPIRNPTSTKPLPSLFLSRVDS